MGWDGLVDKGGIKDSQRERRRGRGSRYQSQTTTNRGE